MSEKMQWYLVAYDIREPARLKRVAKHLKGFGERVCSIAFSGAALEKENWNACGGNY